MTSLAEEVDEQKRWIARGQRRLDAHHALLANEFDTPEGQHERVAVPLRRILGIAAAHVPHYRALFREKDLDPAIQDPFEVLAAMPVLQKAEVVTLGDRLVAEVFPEARDRIVAVTVSSGTTGRPTRISHSLASARILGVLKQREYRWFRFDPASTLGSIHIAAHLPRQSDGSLLRDGQVLQQAAWPTMSGVFATGRHFCFNVTNPVGQQLDFLRRLKPRYLLACPQSLELLALAAAPDWPSTSLEGLLAVSEPLTPGMRRHIKRSFASEVHQNYGLNEIGAVAVRCAAGRYHVHTENCHVEVLGDDGKPVAPGATGRLIVTALANTAMPLLRYDTGDLGVACDTLCPCGRTMPAFADVIGRYSTIAHLPPGTLESVAVLREAIAEMEPRLVRGLRQIQIHQYRDGRFELRVVTDEAVSPIFVRAAGTAWHAAARGGPLAIQRVEAIARSPGGTFQVFTSDFMPAFSPDAGKDDVSGEALAVLE
jgi:phenylacetate-CoA ligase